MRSARSWMCAATAVVALALAAQAEPVGPLLSDNGWTPVTSSRVLPRPPQLPPQVQQQQQQEAEDRISIEDVEELLEEEQTEEPAESDEPLPSHANPELVKTNSDDSTKQEAPQLEEANQEEEESHTQSEQQEQSEIPHHEQSQPTERPLKAVETVTEPEKAPIIVYPEGAQSSNGPQDYFRPEQPRPDPFPQLPPSDYRPDFLNEQQPSAFLQGPPPQPPHIYHRERVPFGPPPPPPRPLRPLPGPPPQEQLGEGLARHQEAPYDVSGQELSPYPVQPPPPPPPQGPPPPGPPRPRPRPGPPAKPGVLASLGSRFSSIGSSIKCAAEDYATDGRLTDKAYMQGQIACLLDEGPCDKDGLTIKRLAPDIMKGLCPGDCDECKKQQIQKVMATFTQKYPYEYSLMLKKFTG